MHRFLFLFIVAILTQTLMASPYIPNQSCPGDISLAVEWIYFSPSSETDFFAVPNNEAAQIDGTEVADRFDHYFSGYRLGFGYNFCCESCERYISFLWSSLRANANQSAFNENGFFTAFGSTTGQTVNYSKKFRYYAVDGIIGQNVISHECVNVDVLMGIHYAHFFSKANLDSPIETTLLVSSELNSYWGIGPELGLHTIMPLCYHLSLIGDISTAILVGRPFHSVEQPGFFFDNIERIWRFVPYTNLRVALDYDFCIPWICYKRGVKANVQIGYEGLIYFGAFSNTAVISNLFARNVSLHGPFASLSVSF